MKIRDNKEEVISKEIISSS